MLIKKTLVALATLTALAAPLCGCERVKTQDIGSCLLETERLEAETHTGLGDPKADYVTHAMHLRDCMLSKGWEYQFRPTGAAAGDACDPETDAAMPQCYLPSPWFAEPESQTVTNAASAKAPPPAPPAVGVPTYIAPPWKAPPLDDELAPAAAPTAPTAAPVTGKGKAPRNDDTPTYIPPPWKAPPLDDPAPR